MEQQQTARKSWTAPATSTAQVASASQPAPTEPAAPASQPATAPQPAPVVPRYDEQGNIIPLGDDFVAGFEFAARAAAQTDAFLDEGSEGRSSAPHRDPARDEARREKAAKAADYRAKLAGMDFDERLAATLECLGRRGTFRDILFGLLGFCQEERPYEEIEPYVASFPEFRRNRQSERRYVHLLLRTGALEEIELAEDGNPLTLEAKQAAIDEGLDPEDVDELVFDWRVVTTDVGRAALEEFSPQVRMGRLLSEDPSREEAYLKIMAFCEEPRTLGSITDAFRSSGLLGFDEKSRQMRQPSAYVERLERAGALGWNGSSWRLTESGRAYLEARQGAAAQGAAAQACGA